MLAVAVLTVAVDHVRSTPAASTGVAPIFVDKDGRNSIVIVNGANDLLTLEHVEACKDMFAEAKVVVGQLEIPAEVRHGCDLCVSLDLQITLAALKLAKSQGTTWWVLLIEVWAYTVVSIFNAAPARAELDSAFYSTPDIFCVNESEAQMLSNIAVVDEAVRIH